MHQNKHKHHIPVLLDEVLSVLQPQAGESYLDLTAGYGGHAQRVIELTNAPSKATLVDRDQSAQEVLQKKFSKAELLHNDFETVSKQLAKAQRRYDLVLADIGVSSPHLNDSSRGFSLRNEGPLDMRMDRTRNLTAETVVNSYELDDLRRILKQYGEEPKADRIARAIIAHRPLRTTTQLADIVASAWKGRSKVHPATRTFQAIRIEVNDELGMLERSLPYWVKLLAPDGRLAVISFHSLEDRIVKQFLNQYAGDRYDAVLQLVTKRPLTAKESELVSNPRARSAKLRAAVKIKRKGE